MHSGDKLEQTGIKQGEEIVCWLHALGTQGSEGFLVLPAMKVLEQPKDNR